MSADRPRPNRLKPNHQQPRGTDSRSLKRRWLGPIHIGDQTNRYGDFCWLLYEDNPHPVDSISWGTNKNCGLWTGTPRQSGSVKTCNSYCVVQSNSRKGSTLPSIDPHWSIIRPDTMASIYDCAEKPENSKVTVARIGSRAESSTTSLKERLIVLAVESGSG